MLASILVVAVTAGIAVAATSPSYRLTPNSLAAGGYGGGIAKSSSYVMVVGLGDVVGTSSTSGSYDLCVGLCLRRGQTPSITCGCLAQHR